MKNKVTLLNILSSIGMQLISIVSALIVPRLILETFGSNVNGLVSSITQFLNYITLIEGGITGVIAANLYRPLVEKDEQKLSSVLSAARSFYRKIGAIFVGYSVIVGIIYPMFVNTGYDDFYVFVLTIVLSMGLMLEYMFSLTYTTLLNADKKIYLVSIISSIITIINIILTIIVVENFPDIILLKLANAILFALKPLAYGIYVKKYYKIDWNVRKDNNLIEQRWNGFAINLAFFIHMSTDVTLLTIFSDLKSVSVYSIYYLIISKISIIVNAITSSIEPAIGQAYAKKNEEQLNEKLDLYEFIVIMTVGWGFLVTGLLLTPFVMLYTTGITDTNYYQPVFGAVLVLAEAVYLLRTPHVSLAYSANKFKEVTLPAYVEAIINIGVSIFLIHRIGLVGIAVGTLAGMLYRGAFHIYFTSKLVPARKQRIYYRKLLVLIVTVIFCYLVCTKLFPFNSYSIEAWIIHAMIYGASCICIFAVVGFIFFKKEVIYLIKYLKRR